MARASAAAFPPVNIGSSARSSWRSTTRGWTTPTPCFAVRRPPSAVRRPPSAVRRPSSVVRRRSSVVRRPSSVVRRPSSVVRRPSSVVRRPSSVVRRPSSVVRRPSSVVRRPSSAVRRPPSVVRRRRPLSGSLLANHANPNRIKRTGCFRSGHERLTQTRSRAGVDMWRSLRSRFEREVGASMIQLSAGEREILRLVARYVDAEVRPVVRDLEQRTPIPRRSSSR